MNAILHTTTADIPVTVLSQQFDPLANKTWLLLKSEQPIPHPHYGTTRQGWFDSKRVTLPDADEAAYWQPVNVHPPEIAAALEAAKREINGARKIEEIRAVLLIRQPITVDNYARNVIRQITEIKKIVEI